MRLCGPITSTTPSRFPRPPYFWRDSLKTCSLRGKMNSKTVFSYPQGIRRLLPKCNSKVQKLHFGGIRVAGFPERKSVCDPENDCGKYRKIRTNGQDSDQNVAGKETPCPQEGQMQWCLGSPVVRMDLRT